MDNHEVIEIRTIQDIREKVKPDRLDAFLADLKVWILQSHMPVVDAYTGLLEDIAKSMGVSAEIKKMPADLMLWLDDGQTGLSILNVQDENGKVHGGLHFKLKKENENAG